MKMLISAVAALLLLAPIAHGAEHGNDDSCDIAILPAATLLLPYFEVDIGSSMVVAKTTAFTVTNVTPQPQIATATIWTEWGYPILTFDMFLTGYDMQDINLYDVLVRGMIAPDRGTSNRVTPGSRSASNISGNPNFHADAANNCSSKIANRVPAPAMRALHDSLTLGVLSSCSNQRVGEEHPGIARGYVTIDVNSNCGTAGPSTPGYFDSILYDNVLTGDYRYIEPDPTIGNYAAGSPLVHIRAVPEGGKAGVKLETPLSYTFYDRFSHEGSDRRQPLPSTFAARFIEGGPATFQTDLILWREPLTGLGATCADFTNNVTELAYVVRFDERENATVLSMSTPPKAGPATRKPTTSSDFPALSGSGDVGGWMYLDLDDTTPQGRPSQSWVVTTMYSEGRYSVAVDATALTNGCAAADTRFRPTATAEIQPDDSCDIALQPAATLLLPYFEVEIDKPQNEAVTTLLTVANVSPRPQIAKVTLWTDYGYPVLSFNVILTGFDVQALNLYDVLAKGILAIDSNGVRAASHGTTNANFMANALAECAKQQSSLSPALLENVRRALRDGYFPLSCGSESVGGTHEAAVGYATIDLVATCSGTLPTGGWYVNELLFDNVLTGDYEVVRPDARNGNYAGGNPLVHVRAFPEGGKAGTNTPGRTATTFWSGLTGVDGVVAGADRRQPLPSAFAVRYIQGGSTGFLTDVLVWREPTVADGSCSGAQKNGASMEITELVRFDERENPFVATSGSETGEGEQHLPAASSIASSSSFFPVMTSGDVAGWFYMNLQDNKVHGRATQSWVSVRMFAEGRYSVDVDATPLGNGCNTPIPNGAVIAPPK